MWSIIIVIIHVVLMWTRFISIFLFEIAFAYTKGKKILSEWFFWGFQPKHKFCLLTHEIEDSHIIIKYAWRVEYSQTCLPPPRSIPACPKPGPCIFSGCVMLTYCYLLSVFHVKYFVYFEICGNYNLLFDIYFWAI